MLRIALIDEIQEHEVVSSLAVALRVRGHAVFRSGRLTHGSGAASNPIEWSALAAAQRELKEFCPDVVLLLRPQSWPVEYSADLRRGGVKVVPWLSDGPVLYKTGYFRSLEEADFILHCGHSDVISFYEELGTTPVGVNFPFWSEDKPDKWSLQSATQSAPVFLGNVHDSVRRDRLEILEAIRPLPHLYGKISGADRNRVNWRGIIDSGRDLARLIVRHRFAVNIPQRYKDYRDSKFDFPGLSELGGFQTPSRTVQYAAAGIPTLTMGITGMRGGGVDGQLVAESQAELVDAAMNVSDEDLLQISNRMRIDHSANFTPESRVLFLEYLLSSAEWQSFTAETRTNLYRNFGGTKVKGTECKLARGESLVLKMSSRARRIKRAKRIALFSPDWQSPGTELQEVRRKLRLSGYKVSEWGPSRLGKNMTSDPLCQFKGLISETSIEDPYFRQLDSLVLVGAEYGLTSGMWRVLRSRRVKVLCLTDPSGGNSAQRARLSARSDISTTIKVDVAERSRALELKNHGFADFSAPAVRVNKMKAARRGVHLVVAPLDPVEIRALSGFISLEQWGIIVLSSSYFQFPGRARQLLRLSAEAGCSVIAPRDLFDVLAIRPIEGIYGYGSDEELQRQLQHVKGREIERVLWQMQYDGSLHSGQAGGALKYTYFGRLLQKKRVWPHIID